MVEPHHEQLMQQMAHLSPEEIKQMHFACMLTQQHHEELAKIHLFEKLEATPAEIEEFCGYLMDGGGVEDHAVLVEILLKAIEKRDWPTIRKQIPHVFKHALKQRGKVRRLGPSGAVLKTVSSQLAEDAYQKLTAPPAK